MNFLHNLFVEAVWLRFELAAHLFSKGQVFFMDKRIAPTLWAMIIIIIIFFYGASFMHIPIFAVRAIGIVVTLCLAGAIVAVLRERYKEIKGGESDDLDNY